MVRCRNGGHVHPMSGVGERLLWKKVQKNAEKNMISDTMKRIIPHSSPCCTFMVWVPHKGSFSYDVPSSAIYSE